VEAKLNTHRARLASLPGVAREMSKQASKQASARAHEHTSTRTPEHARAYSNAMQCNGIPIDLMRAFEDSAQRMIGELQTRLDEIEQSKAMAPADLLWESLWERTHVE